MGDDVRHGACDAMVETLESDLDEMRSQLDHEVDARLVAEENLSVAHETIDYYERIIRDAVIGDSPAGLLDEAYTAHLISHEEYEGALNPRGLVRHLRQQLSQAAEDHNELAGEFAGVQVAIRALHPIDPDGKCSTCAVAHPCPTIRALDGDA